MIAALTGRLVAEHKSFPAQASLPGVVSMAGLLGAYFGLRVCITFLFFRADPQAGAEAGFALNLLLLLPACLYAAGPASMTVREALNVPTFRLVLGFLFLALLSISWSETQSRAVAFGYWTALATDVVLVLLLLHAEPAKRVSESLMKGFVAGACVLAVVVWMAPAMSDLRLGDDEFLNPNAIGFECAFAVLLSQHLAPRGARWKWMGALLAVTLVRSLSKTSILAFLIAETFYLSSTSAIRRSSKLAIVGAALFVLAIFSSLFSAYYTVYSNAGDQAETLTGRTAIWIVTLGLAFQEPWFGHGIHSFRSVVPAFGAFQPWHAHNELLHQFFVYGLAGVGLVVALYGALFAQLRRSAANPLNLLTRALLLLVVVRGIADTERFDLSFPLWAITLISLTLAQKQECL